MHVTYLFTYLTLMIQWITSTHTDAGTHIHFARSSQWLCPQSWLSKCPRWCCACLICRPFPFPHHRGNQGLNLSLTWLGHVGKPSLLGLYQGHLQRFLSGLRLHRSPDSVPSVLQRLSPRSSLTPSKRKCHWTGDSPLFSAKWLKEWKISESSVQIYNLCNLRCI